MILAVLVDLPERNPRVRRILQAFRETCWAADVPTDFVDITSYDSRARHIEVVPTVYVYNFADPYGEPLVEHRGAFTAEDIAALLERGRALV